MKVTTTVLLLAMLPALVSAAEWWEILNPIWLIANFFVNIIVSTIQESTGFEVCPVLQKAINDAAGTDFVTCTCATEAVVEFFFLPTGVDAIATCEVIGSPCLTEEPEKICGTFSQQCCRN